MGTCRWTTNQPAPLVQGCRIASTGDRHSGARSNHRQRRSGANQLARRPGTRSLGRRTSFDRLICIADRLAEVTAGSLLADLAIHDALGLTGVVMPYTRNEAAARGLLPAGFEWYDNLY
jgi:hypothetical protein